MWGVASNPLANFFIGVDLGQSRDPTAITVVQYVPGNSVSEAIYRVGHIERLPLGTPYLGVIGHVGRLMARLPGGKTPELVIDFTGVGRPVFEMFTAKAFTPTGVSITAGGSVTHEAASI